MRNIFESRRKPLCAEVFVNCNGSKATYVLVSSVDVVGGRMCFA
jgi:hypothetical protein